MTIRAVFNYAVCMRVLRICQGCIYNGDLADSRIQNATIPLFPSFQVLKMVLLQFKVDRYFNFYTSHISHGVAEASMM